MFASSNAQNALPVISLAGAAASVTGPNQDASRGRGLLVFINVSAISGTGPSLTVTVQGYDPISQQYYTILASAAITATGLTVLRVYPGLTAAANAAANDIMPPNFRVTATIAGTGPAVTASINTQVVE